jgi:hypothetical protein
MGMKPDALLAGPRGRRLCLEAALGELRYGESASAELFNAVFHAAYDLDPGRGTARVMFGPGAHDRPRFTAADVAGLLDAVPLPEPNDRELVSALAAAVDNARYWQEPAGEDVLAAAPELRAGLARVAASLTATSATDWWSASVDLPGQWSVAFPGTDAERDRLLPPHETLERWRRAQADEEERAQRDRPTDPRAAFSGTWWSKPPHGLARTSRRIDELGPVGLWLVEDGMGWERATVQRVRVASDARIFEIDGPEAWAALCRQHPLEVTASRRHDWYRTTGRSGRWVIPDWSRLAPEFDGIHLTVAGYLMTAGRAVAVDGERMTVLAGWDPDLTYWLSDITSEESSVEKWRRDRDEGWTRAGD